VTQPPTRHPSAAVRLWAAAAIGLFALALYMPGIGVGDFVGDDEALDAGVVSEMIRTGDWMFPEFNGEYLPPKPPVFYWAAAGLSKARGRADEVSLRVPSALAGAMTVAVTVAGAAPAVGAGQAALAGLMLATMPLMVGESRIGRCDMTLTLLVTACLLLVGARAGPMPRSARWLFWSLLGLAVLTKGGAGFGLVTVVVVSAAVVERDATRLRELACPSVAAFFVLGGSWYLIATAHWGMRFVDEQLVGENLHHLFGGAAISGGGSGNTPLAEHLVYYVVPLFSKMFPWSLLLPGALLGLWKATPGRSPLRFFAVWLLAGLAFFTMVSRKSPYYILPLAPAVAVLAADSVFARVRDSLVSEPFDPGLSRWWVGCLLAASILIWLAAFAVRGAACDLQAFAGAIGDRPLISIPSLWLLLCSAFGLASSARRRRCGAALVCTIALASAFVMLQDQIEGRLDDCHSLKPFAEEIRSHVGADERVFFFRLPLPAVALYAERRIPTLRHPAADQPAEPFYLVVPDSLAPEIPPAWLANAETVASGHARVFTRRSMGIRLLRIVASSTPTPGSRDEGDDVPLGAVPAAEEAREPRSLDEQHGPRELRLHGFHEPSLGEHDRARILGDEVLELVGVGGGNHLGLVAGPEIIARRRRRATDEHVPLGPRRFFFRLRTNLAGEQPLTAVTKARRHDDGEPDEHARERADDPPGRERRPACGRLFVSEPFGDHERGKGHDG
jgi:4-amino-4-deoxy-L-arabinose transferase-like glycosyltransferase